jgi:hypothetical protein
MGYSTLYLEMAPSGLLATEQGKGFALTKVVKRLGIRIHCVGNVPIVWYVMASTSACGGVQTAASRHASSRG